MKKYRNNGAIGALLDEYEKAITELKNLIAPISPATLIAVVDEETENVDCRSIQSILTHVIRAGYWYVIEVRKSEGETLTAPESVFYEKVEDYQVALEEMFQYTEKLFTDYPELDIYQKIDIRWKHIYNVDLLMEHAIVHILRHRRQIERFLLKIDI